MSLNTLVDYISNSQITSELIKRISKNNELNIVGSSRYAKSIILDSIAKKEEKNILLICPNEEIAYKWIGYFESINDFAMLSKIIDFAYLLEPIIFNSLFFEILFINSEVICEFEI